MKPLVSLFLIAGPNDPNPDQEKLRQKLEPEARKYLDSYFTVEEPNASRSVLHSLLTTWLGATGCKVRFEIAVDGEVKGKEVTSVEELNGLIGSGKTPATLLQALGGAPFGPAPRP
jgi:hypothetical protein